MIAISRVSRGCTTELTKLTSSAALERLLSEFVDANSNSLRPFDREVDVRPSTVSLVGGEHAVYYTGIRREMNELVLLACYAMMLGPGLPRATITMVFNSVKELRPEFVGLCESRIAARAEKAGLARALTDAALCVSAKTRRDVRNLAVA